MAFQKRKSKGLQVSLPLYAAALGRKFGVQVVCQGTEMKTNGTVIYVPAFDPDEPPAGGEGQADIRVWLEDLTCGVLAHEAGGHIAHTDFQAARPKDELGFGLYNIIEDVRIESLLYQKYPGTRATIGKVLEWLVITGQLPPAKDGDHAGTVLHQYLLTKLRSEVLDQEVLAPLAEQSATVLRKTFPKGMVTRLHGLLSEVPDLESTSDSVDLALRVLQMMKEEQEKAEEEQQQPQRRQPKQKPDATDNDQPQKGQGSAGQSDKQSDANGDNNGSAGAGNSQGGGSPSGEESDGAGGGGSADAEASDASGKNQGSSGNGGSNGGEAQPGAPDQTAGKGGLGSGAGSGDGSADAIREALGSPAGVIPKDVFNAVADQISGAAKQMPAIRVADIPRPDETIVSVAEHGEERLRRVKATSGKLMAQLQGLVQASTLCHPVVRKTGRSINPSRMHRALVGDPRVFVRRDEKLAPNAAIHLLVDRSGSMGRAIPSAQIPAVKQPAANTLGGAEEKKPARNMLDVAVESAVALGLALEGIRGTNPAVSAFPGTSGGYNAEGHWITPLLCHGQSIRRSAGNFGISPTGGTPMAGAIWYAALQLLQQKEERKMLVVCTDGAPDRVEDVRYIVDRAQASGIEVIGIGIGTPAVLGLFPTATVIRDVMDLKKALFEIAKRALLAA